MIEDDAARYLASLPPDRRVEEVGMGGLPKTGPSFTAEERKLAWEIFFPKKSEP